MKYFTKISDLKKRNVDRTRVYYTVLFAMVCHSYGRSRNTYQAGSYFLAYPMLRRRW